YRRRTAHPRQAPNPVHVVAFCHGSVADPSGRLADMLLALGSGQASASELATLPPPAAPVRRSEPRWPGARAGPDAGTARPPSDRLHPPRTAVERWVHASWGTAADVREPGATRPRQAAAGRQPRLRRDRADL